MRQHNRRLFTILFTIFALFGVALFFLMRQVNKNVDNRDNLEKYQFFLIDSLTRVNGQNAVEKQSLETSRDFFIEQSSNQSVLIQQLQDLVKSQKTAQSAIVAVVTTRDSGNTRTEMKFDTVQVKEPLKFFPIYSSSWSDKWSTGVIIATKDSIFHNIKVFNNFEVSQKRDGKNIVVYWKNNNPLSQTDSLYSWTIEQPKVKAKKFGVGFQIGYGVSKTGLSPFLGLGLSYNFINF